MGFKTLKDFNLVLRPGINALVGSNGSGKTTILKGLEFISHLVRTNLNEIPTKMACADPADLFDLMSDNKEIDVKLIGTDITFCRDITSSETIIEKVKGFIPLRTNYSLSFTIGFTCESETPLIYKNQVVSLDFKLKLDGEIKSNSLALDYNKGKLEARDFELTEIAKYVCEDANNVYESISPSSKKFSEKSMLIELSDKLYPVTSFLEVLNFDKAFDIYPDGIRNESKQKIHPGIKFDGRGLPSTLLNFLESNPKRFKIFEDSIKAVSADIHKLQVNYDKQTKEISVDTMQFIDQFGQYCVVPLNLLADGMLKWYSLIAALEFAHKNIVIDEPENFLDNRMQQVLTDFIRQELDETDLMCVMATHSETLMNSLIPDEIVFVSIKDGRTVAERVADPDKLLKRIAESGKSLGQYYETGSLELFLESNVD